MAKIYSDWSDSATNILHNQKRHQDQFSIKSLEELKLNMQELVDK